MKDDYKILKSICRKICSKYRVDNYEDVFHDAIAKFLESGEEYYFYRLINYIKYTALDYRNTQYTRHNKNMSRVISLSDIVLMSHQYSYLFDALSFDPEQTHIEIEDDALFVHLLSIPNQNAAYYNTVKSIYLNRKDKDKLRKIKRTRSYYHYLKDIQQYTKDFQQKSPSLGRAFL